MFEVIFFKLPSRCPKKVHQLHILCTTWHTFFPFEKCIKPLDFSIMSDKKRHRNSSRATADRNEKSRDNNVQMRCLLRSNANLMNAIHLIVAGSALLVAQAAWLLLLLLTQLFKLRRFRHHFHGEEEREKTKSSTLSSQVLVHSWNSYERSDDWQAPPSPPFLIPNS